MKRNVLMIILAAIILVTACDKDDSRTAKLTTLDIVNASSLFIASGNSLKSSSANSSDEGNRLFKITDAGYIEEVTYYDEDGNPITHIEYPTGIYNLNEDYIIVVFGYGYNGYLARKSDGAVFSLTEAGLPGYTYIDNYINWPETQMDDHNNAYYLIEDYMDESLTRIRLLRVNLNNPENITAKIISPSEESLEGFFVNKHGDAAYHSWDDPSRVITAAGGMVNAPHIDAGYWLGGDRELYTMEWLGHQLGQIYKMTVHENILQLEPYGDTLDLTFFSGYSFLLNLQDKVYIICTHYDKTFEVWNTSATPHRIFNLPLRSTSQATASDSYYYLSGDNDAYQPTLVKVYAATNTPEILLTPGEFDIYHMTVSSDDHLTFSALRMSDGKLVMGEIDDQGNLNILDEESGWDIISLERIN